MKNSFFLDTGGIYAFLVKKDANHENASALIRKAIHAGGHAVTTDYIIDETATLLKARGYGHAVPHLFDGIMSSTVCRLEWMDPDYFDKTKAFFIKHNDHGWSFTDCFSFITMKRLGLKDALTHHDHFREAGFIPLLTHN